MQGGIRSQKNEQPDSTYPIQVISKLQEEKQRIEPVVQADRKTIEAVFQLQDQRYASSVRRERWIGFGIGVVSSLVATILWVIRRAWWSTKKLDELSGIP